MLSWREGADARMAGREASEGEVAEISSVCRMELAVIVAAVAAMEAVAAVAAVMAENQGWADFYSDVGMGLSSVRLLSRVDERRGMCVGVVVVAVAAAALLAENHCDDYICFQVEMERQNDG